MAKKRSSDTDPNPSKVTIMAKKRSSDTDPNLPPPENWPCKENSWVYYVRMCGISIFHASVEKGKVTHYNAAKVGTCVTTKGKPYFGVKNGSRYDFVPIKLVFAPSKVGKAAALRELAKMKQDTAKELLESAQESADKLMIAAKKHIKEADKLQQNPYAKLRRIK